MELVNIRDIFRNTQEYANKEVTIGGWVRSNRNSKNFGFIVVNDGTFFEPIQVVYADGLMEIAKKAGVIDGLVKRMGPVLRFLFPRVPESTLFEISRYL